MGRHVLAALRRRGIEPIVASRKGAVSATTHVVLDIHQPPADAFDQLGRPDVLIHLAWGGLPNYLSLHHFEDELPAQHRFLKAMVAAGLRNLVVTGTCFEYGMQSGALSEDVPATPANPYGFAKDSLRRQLQYLQAKLPFNLTWTRLFYSYGEGQAATSLLPLLRQAVERGEAAFNMSAGEQLRDFMPVERLADELVSLAVLQRDCGVVNLCSGEPVSVRRLVEQWIRENHWNIALNLGHYPYPAYEPLAFWGDRTKLERLLHAGSATTTH